jgi:O-acetylserine/cysteine efflux transporter
VFLREVPNARQVLGMSAAFAGLALIGWTVGAELRPAALLLALAGALSWAVGNLVLKRLPRVPMVSLVVWCSLVPPLPALLLASGSGGSANLARAVLDASWPSLAAAVYLGVVATVLAYASWGRLLQRYPAAVVAPFALLSPCAGVLASAAIFGEVFSPLRYAGMALILGGLAVILLPAGWVQRVKPAAGRAG